MRKLRLGIIDYNVGNLGSVQNAFFHITRNAALYGLRYELEYCLESRAENLGQYDKLLLPGVGAFGNAMAHLEDSYLDEAIKAFARSGKALLGICLGMQLLFERSFEFGEHRGLGLIEGEVVGFDFKAREDSALGAARNCSSPLKVPHIGWNSCAFTSEGRQNPLLERIDDESYFYFVHSFHIKTSARHILAQCEYGYPFGAIAHFQNLYAIQAHPEKSHRVGLQLLANFVNL